MNHSIFHKIISTTYSKQVGHSNLTVQYKKNNILVEFQEK